MQPFSTALSFRHPWRKYQERVLGEFENHISDDHFHLVAAPGAGKTVLGLEVLCRLGRPALVLTPSLAIRNQWIERFTKEFKPHSAATPTASTDLRALSTLTVTTYQALSVWVEALGFDAAAAALAEAQVGTLVCDESHHLRRRWWRDLFGLKKALRDITIISLTATPPYDVAQVEWNRYAALPAMSSRCDTSSTVCRKHWVGAKAWHNFSSITGRGAWARQR